MSLAGLGTPRAGGELLSPRCRAVLAVQGGSGTCPALAEGLPSIPAWHSVPWPVLLSRCFPSCAEGFPTEPRVSFTQHGLSQGSVREGESGLLLSLFFQTFCFLRNVAAKPCCQSLSAASCSEGSSSLGGNYANK